MAAEHVKHEPTTLIETIALDSYDDVFSDFDYGPFETRRLSQDLLAELSGRLHRKGGNISLVFQMPEKLREHEVEAMVKTRLHQVFMERWKSAGVDISANQRTAFLNETIRREVVRVVEPQQARAAFGETVASDARGQVQRARAHHCNTLVFHCCHNRLL